MSKAIPLAIVVVLASLCIALAMQTNTIATLHSQLTASRASAAASASALAKAQAESARLTELTQSYKAQAGGMGTKLTGSPEAPGDTAKEEAASTPDFSEAMKKMFSDPAMKKMMRSQQGAAIRMIYGDLAKELNLTKEQADTVLKILADRQAATMESGMAMMDDGKLDPEAMQKAGEETNAQNAKYEDQLKAALGDKYSAYQDYEKSIADRSSLKQYESAFDGAGQALTDDQRAGLLKIMSEERANSPSPTPLPADGDVAAQLKAFSSDQALHDMMARQGDINQRVLARAGSVLSEEQLATFADTQKQMEEMQQVGLRMSRSMFKSK